MEVFVSNRQSFLEINNDTIQPIVEEVLLFEKKSYDEVSIFFVSLDGISHLHAQYFNDPSTTDCISFPMDDDSEPGYRVLGDIFICPETARDFLSRTNTSPLTSEIYKETTLYLVHGLLHLLGYDDIEENDRQVMRNREKSVMDSLAQKNLFLHP